MQHSKRLKHKLYMACLAVLITFVSAVAVTFAWYIYNTQKHTTNVHMAAGTGTTLQISNQYGEGYGNSTILDEFKGSLNPVSTNRISGGFQKVTGFTNGDDTQSKLLANLFGKSDSSDYYKTTLYLRTSGDEVNIYLSKIGYSDSSQDNPISTAIRVGLVPHSPGENQPTTGEYIFAINTEDNPQADYNTATGQEGYVLDADQTNGTTVPFQPLTSENYCEYNSGTGVVTLLPYSQALCSVEGSDNSDFGVPVQIDVYIWLEGCDKDCVNNLGAMTLENLALSFAGYKQ